MTSISNLLRRLAGRATKSLSAVVLFGFACASANAYTPPTVKITSPTEGQIIPQGSAITVAASITVNDPSNPIDHVDFYVGDVNPVIDTTAPYSVTISNPRLGRNGYSVRAYDKTGSVLETVTVYVNQTPWGDITAPESGSILQTPTSVVLAADAIGTEGVASVQFRVDGVAVGTDTTAPFQVTWTNPSAGVHTIDAVVTDALGDSAPSKDNAILTVIGPPPAAATITDGASRDYVYNANQELCQTVDPETGATYYGYDAAGNLSWSAGGYAASSGCSSAASVVAHRVDRTYDSRNRLIALSFPDGRGNQTFAYTPDGLPASIVTDNGGNQVVTNAYSYNRRRMMIGERMQWGAIDWAILYGYDANAHLSALTYPDGANVALAPNALGQPTRVGAYADTVSYYPNGAIGGFIYGNSIAHTMTQNDRQMPDRSRDVFGGTAFLDYSYDYDANANVAAISDALPGNRGNRTMQYDGLDRLVKATSPMFADGAANEARYTYDSLDNLRTAHVKDRNLFYCYDPTTWLLTNVKSGYCTTGATITGLSYDERGNVSRRNGVGFDFDYGNRLRGTSDGVVSGYVYDAYGRRVRDVTTASKYSLYSNEGLLLYTSDFRAGKATNYYYLGASLIAMQEKTTATGAIAVKYQHTDALGTPVAVTDQLRAVIERSEYEPYGRLLNRPMADGPGFTGHMADAATGMVYMQQRYYDDDLGRFMSVDPITADTATGGNFNRYWYANNNPYSFIDQDGRGACGKDTSCALARGDWGGGGVEAYNATHEVPMAPDSRSASNAAPVAHEMNKWEQFLDRAGLYGDLTQDGNIFDADAFGGAVFPPIMDATEIGGGARLSVAGGRFAVKLGQEGEAAVQAAYNIGSKGRFQWMNRQRIADGINDMLGTISEVKNTAYQGWTRQLRDYAAYARANDLTFTLYLRAGARESRLLRAAEKSGLVVIREIPR